MSYHHQTAGNSNSMSSRSSDYSSSTRRVTSQSSSSSSSSYRSQPIQNPYIKSKTGSQKSCTVGVTESDNGVGNGIGNDAGNRSNKSLTSSLSPSSSSPSSPSRLSSSSTSRKDFFSSSSSSSSSTLLPNCRDLYNALCEYCNTSTNANNNNNHNDVNTSFSVASHAIRQRKLLRNITFELKQLANLNLDEKNNNERSSSSDSGSSSGIDISDEYGSNSSFFLKGVGCNKNHDVIISSSLSNSSANSSTNSNSNVDADADQQIVEYMLQVMKSVNALLLEEYYEKRELAVPSSSGTGRQNNDGDESCMNISTSAYQHQHQFHHNRNNADHNNVDNDSLLALLEFLNLAYASLESNIVFASLQTAIDCEGFHCVDITKHLNDDDDNDDNDDATEEQNDSCFVLDALLFFILDPNGNGTINHRYDEIDNNQDEDEEDVNNMSFLPYNSRSTRAATASSCNWEPTKIQALALSALTKAILNAESVQRYCTSLSIIPEEGIDSLLGDGMGIGLVNRHKEEMTIIVQMAMCYLSSIPLRAIKKGKQQQQQQQQQRQPSSSSDYQKNDNEIFRLASMSLLSCLFRTNASEWMLVQLPPRHTKKMISVLYQCSRSFDDEVIMKKSDSYDTRTGCSNFNRANYVSSVLAQSLLMVIEWKSPGSTEIENCDNILGNEESILKLAGYVFSSRSLDRNSNLRYGGSIHLFIHLCIVHSEQLRLVLKKERMLSLMKASMLESIRKSGGKENNHGLYIIMLHFIVTYPQCRRLLSDIMKQDDDMAADTHGPGFESFLHIILKRANDVRLNQIFNIFDRWSLHV
jgi:hypothetical protein